MCRVVDVPAVSVVHWKGAKELLVSHTGELATARAHFLKVERFEVNSHLQECVNLIWTNDWKLVLGVEHLWHGQVIVVKLVS